LRFDPAANLYGITSGGGFGNSGTVFKLTPNHDASWTEKVLYRFLAGKDGGHSQAGLTFDQAGNLYGTTASNRGAVFQLTPNSDGSWTEQVLHRFTKTETDGKSPWAGVTLDAAGNLYGTTQKGGIVTVTGCIDGEGQGCGVVFKLTPNSKGGWRETVLKAFSDHPAALPYTGVILDAAGNLYGTTHGEPPTSVGTVFEITP
jgi:hypothetical protein